MLGFEISEPTVSRWLRRAPRPHDPVKRWLTFLRNHREAIAAMDFFTVPTLTFGIRYCFFVIPHDRRRILHCNVSRNPQAVWVALQLLETWEYDKQPQRFLLFDRDSKFSADVVATVKAVGCQPLPRMDPVKHCWSVPVWSESCGTSRTSGGCSFPCSELRRAEAKLLQLSFSGRMHNARVPKTCASGLRPLGMDMEFP